ncbi:hypothetical protein EIP91_009276 [Steccherinum ochraceum]|uniref:Uncharacterized protein n=1 Tax=Steccherinum ochraceum TaxID=92696 RepID=A0A4R0R1U9_9APHY|nr:hypothetical protein EIP91_009276 [Steccherinum ochraceum]
MSDDAYFDEDLVLDDDLIAVLDAEEQRHQKDTQPQASKPTIVRHTPPPAKKQKTNHQWSSKPGPLQRVASVDEYGDLPEISIQGDGTYGVAIQAPAQRPVNGAPSSRPAIPPPRPLANAIPTGQTASSSRRPLHQPIARTLAAQQPVIHRNATASSAHRPQLSSRPSNGPPVPSQGRVEQRTELSDLRDKVENRHQVSRRTSGESVSISRVPSINGRVQPQTAAPSSQRISASQARSSMSAQEKADQMLRTELNILRSQMDELRKAEIDLRQELQQARDARFAKEGEVSILRNNIDKINDQHTTELERLKAAKEAAETMAAQVKQNMREELDRVKTQFTFKQHELETNVRRTPVAHRAVLAARQGFTSSPIPSTQMKAWTSSSQVETPQKPKVALGSPKVKRNRKPEYEQLAGLGGFQSGFDATPVKAKGKGKQREMNAITVDVFDPPPPPPMFTSPSSPRRQLEPSQGPAARIDAPMEEAMPFPSADVSNPPGLSAAVDHTSSPEVDMMEEVKAKEEPPPEIIGGAEPPDWRHELQHIVLTHHPRATPAQLTIQHVINTSIPASHADQSTVFTSSARRLLETLGATSTFTDWDPYLRTVAASLASMAGALATSSSIPPLVSLLDLIRTLSYCIPSFTSSLLSPAEDVIKPAVIMTALSHVIISYLNPDNQGFSSEETIPLAMEVFKLLETLWWSVPDDLAPRLSGFFSDYRVVMVLTSPRQSMQTLIHATRTLAFLASQRTLFRQFLTLPPGNGADPQAQPTYYRLPQIERLAAYLSDSSREGPEAQQLRENILAFIATLSTAHSDALTIISQSYTLIPSIILFLSNVSAPFWEDDVELMSSPEQISSCITLMSRTLSLLYYMVCSPTPKYNLSDKLQMAQRPFNGLPHVFAVTFGRFSFADAPEWVDDAGRAQVESLADMARELLELVMDGPELEMIWASFQPDPEGSKKMPIELDDDEDEEALMMQTDES